MKNNNVVKSGILFLIVLFTFFKLEGFVNPLQGTMTEIEKRSFVGTIGIEKTNSK